MKTQERKIFRLAQIGFYRLGCHGNFDGLDPFIFSDFIHFRFFNKIDTDGMYSGLLKRDAVQLPLTENA